MPASRSSRSMWTHWTSQTLRRWHCSSNSCHSRSMESKSFRERSAWLRKRFSLLLFAQELHALATAGLSVVEALDALVEKESSSDTRTIVSRLAVSLREGMRLSTALQQQRGIFPPLFIGIIQAAEGTSDLPRRCNDTLTTKRACTK